MIDSAAKRAAICYYSKHHGNTRKVVEAMALEGDADLIDITAAPAVHLEGYERIGFASGIYGFETHPSVSRFLEEHLPEGKKVFCVYTYGLWKGAGVKALAKLAGEEGALLLGEYGCRGYDTFGPFRLVGGAAKGHPDEQDLAGARAFYRGLQGK